MLGEELAATKKVFLEPAWRLPASYSRMIDFPPEGYRFVVTNPPDVRLARSLTHWQFSFDLLAAAGKVLPVVLLKSLLLRRRPPPAGTALTYAHGHLVFRPEPWVVEVEYPSLLLGYEPRHMAGLGGIVERSLASPYCRKIRCWSEWGRRTLLSHLNCDAFGDKIEVIFQAVPPKRFVKEHGSGRVRILMVGSANIKGGSVEHREAREMLAAFEVLRERHRSVELVLRMEVPPDVKRHAGAVAGVTVIDYRIPQAAMEKVFQEGDILVRLAPTTSPFVLLEAMSYELAVVGVRSWANPEYILEGVTGLLIERSKVSPKHRPDPVAVGGLVQKLGLLLESAELRQRLGRAGRAEVETGRFSLARRNEALRRCFDEALADGDQSVKGRA